MHIWSERPGSRTREIGADLITLVWLVIWLSLGFRLYAFLANLAGAGRFVREGGAGITSAGEKIGSALEGLPLVGEGAASGVRGALAEAGDPLITFGTDLERLLLVISALLGLLLVAAAVVPWLNRYLPWRVAKWRRLNAAARAIRGPGRKPRERIRDPQIERLLASRALHRLEYDELLEFTPDPFGDWLDGRHERLAEAELDRVGLRRLR
ncbi:MAG: hypothetical protein M3406_17300 [Chloroflexota bacterium]|nr:hypothetical protein [Chloroflexota bacterium]